MPKYRLHEYIFFFAGLIFIIFLLGVSFYASQTRRDINSKAAYNTPTPAPSSNPPSPTPTPHFVNLACYGCIKSGVAVGVNSCVSYVVTTASGNTCESVGYFSSFNSCAGSCPNLMCLAEGLVCGPGLYDCCHGSCYNWHCRSAVPPTPRTCTTTGVPCTSDGQCCNGQCLPTYIGKVCN